MALISCPECSREVSDRAAACPHCGYPLQAKLPPAGPAVGDADTRVLQALLGQGKIAAIKLHRELHPGTDLATAKEQVERLAANLPAGSGPRVGGAGCLLVAVAAAAFAAGRWAGVF